MNQEFTASARRGKTYRMAMTALMAAVTCVIAPMAIPIGPVPISFTNLAIYLSLYLLGWKWGSVSYLVYVLIGAVGVPVFSGFTGGLGKLAGATGGYIVGFLPMAVIAGLVIDRYQNRGIQMAGMLVGTAVCYAFGTVWFCFVMDSTPLAAPEPVRLPLHPGRSGEDGRCHDRRSPDPPETGTGRPLPRPVLRKREPPAQLRRGLFFGRLVYRRTRPEAARRSPRSSVTSAISGQAARTVRMSRLRATWSFLARVAPSSKRTKWAPDSRLM